MFCWNHQLLWWYHHWEMFSMLIKPSMRLICGTKYQPLQHRHHHATLRPGWRHCKPNHFNSTTHTCTNTHILKNYYYSTYFPIPSACAPHLPKSSACWCWAVYEKKEERNITDVFIIGLCTLLSFTFHITNYRHVASNVLKFPCNLSWMFGNHWG